MLLSVYVYRGGGNNGFFFSETGGELCVHCIYIMCMSDDLVYKFFNH